MPIQSRRIALSLYGQKVIIHGQFSAIHIAIAIAADSRMKLLKLLACSDHVKAVVVFIRNRFELYSKHYTIY